MTPYKRELPETGPLPAICVTGLTVAGPATIVTLL